MHLPPRDASSLAEQPSQLTQQLNCDTSPDQTSPKYSPNQKVITASQRKKLVKLWMKEGSQDHS
eukprot:5330919-Amphidinium_carterae.1